MNNDDKSQAPDMPQAGYTPPPVAPGVQYTGTPDANNYNQSLQVYGKTLFHNSRPR